LLLRMKRTRRGFIAGYKLKVNLFCQNVHKLWIHE
jgi:hypothetical protein